MLNEKTFIELRLAVFRGGSRDQGYTVAEKALLFEVTDFNITEGLVSLLGSYYAYYISYPKSSPAAGIL